MERVGKKYRVKSLSNNKKRINVQNTRTICNLIELKDFERAKKLIPPTIRHLPFYDDSGNPLLHFAVIHRCIAMVEYLLDGGAKIDVTDEVSIYFEV